MAGAFAVVTAATSGQSISKGDKVPKGAYAHTAGEYSGVIYLLNENGAAKQGHAAVIIIKSNGYGDFYSFEKYSDETRDLLNTLLGNNVRGYMATAVDEYGRQISVSVYWFLEMGGIYSDYQVRFKELKKKEEDRDSKRLKGYQREELDRYTHGIYIPITNEQGIAMKQKADEMRTVLTSSDEGSSTYQYNLFAFNCSMVAQSIIAAGGIKPFGPTSGNAVDEKIDIMRITQKPAEIVLKKIGRGEGYIRFRDFKEFYSFCLDLYEKRMEDGTIPKAVYQRGVEAAKKTEGSIHAWHYGTLEELKHFLAVVPYSYSGFIA